MRPLRARQGSFSNEPESPKTRSARRALLNRKTRGEHVENTLSAYRELGPKRYRETSGLYYEDFEVGDVFEHRPGRTITDVDNIWVTLLTLNVQPVHFDAAYAAKTEWKKLLVDSTLTLALLTGMS